MLFMKLHVLLEAARSWTLHLYWPNKEQCENPTKSTGQNGAKLEHLQQSHNINTVQLDTLLSNVKILKLIPDYHKLTIYEALAILS